MNFLNKFFKIEEKGSTVGTEVVAGCITFLSMCYILFVNSGMLGGLEGLSVGGVFTATAIAAIIGTLIMGLFANYPIALAPGMGMNAMFVYTICYGMGFSAYEALALVSLSGIVFLIISVTGVRKAIINAIPSALKKAIGAGIGLFVAYIGLKNAGILEISGAGIPQVGDLGNPMVIIGVFGIILTIVLFIMQVRGAIILGMVGTVIVSLIANWCGLNVGIGKLGSIVSMPEAPAFGKLIEGFKTMEFNVNFFVAIFSLLFLDFFDTAGTLVSVGAKAGLVNENGELQNAERALFADASATVIGAFVGTSSTTSFVESMSGVEAGGRTGLTAVVVAFLFFLSLFFGNLTAIVTSAATVPALVMVGILMMQQVADIDWSDISVAVPAFVAIIFMPLAYSIAVGIAAGFIFYVIAKCAAKKVKEISPIMWVLTALFVVYFVLYATNLYA